MKASTEGLVLVKREGATGRHWITKVKYDANPNAYELWEEPKPAETAKADAFDHDGDGKPGGSSKPDDPNGELPVLRAEYQRVAGKRAFAGWDAETLRKKISEIGG